MCQKPHPRTDSICCLEPGSGGPVPSSQRELRSLAVQEGSRKPHGL